VLTLAPAARAAGVIASPQRACYRSGEKVGFSGTGYSPSASVGVTSDGTPIGSLATDLNGNFTGVLTVGQRRGEKVKTYTATDAANPAVAASVNLKVSALDVNVKPRSGRPGRRLRVTARGFTASKSLYAHVLRGRSGRNVRVGALKGDCHKLKKRKRIFGASTRSGTYTVQFDGKRRYSRRTKVVVRFRVFVFKKRRRGRASAAATSWARI
jgi:hypothetical protein